MATPSDDAWERALHMLQYLKQHKHKGVRFRETDEEPCAFVDASKRDDPHDCRTQYGYVNHWGGPLMTKSGKLNHVRIDSTYNEYAEYNGMALHHCNKQFAQLVWAIQCMQEIGLSAYVSEPTKVLADNAQANKLCAEDLVTAGNMYFCTGYHYNNECVENRYVILTVEYVHTSNNIGDSLTNALGANKIRAFGPHLTGHRSLPTSPTGQLLTTLQGQCINPDSLISCAACRLVAFAVHLVLRKPLYRWCGAS